MGWYIEAVGASATRVELAPVAGDILVEEIQPSTVHEALDGSRVVWVGPTQKPNVKIPELWVEGITDRNRLRSLILSGQKLTLMSDVGESWTVRAVGGWKARTMDLPDRSTNPIFGVTLQLVGV